MPDFPAHASPVINPTTSPRPRTARTLSDLVLTSPHHPSDVHNHGDQYHDDHPGAPPPPSILSPAITPPPTPGTGTPLHNRAAHSTPIDTSTDPLPRPALLETLPIVNCVVRARIPTTNGQEMFLHLYTNDFDKKEHLAIVFGPYIRSRSLDRVREGETEMDRMIRGAYTGRLFPGRVSSRAVGGRQVQTQASPLQKSLQKGAGAAARRSLDGVRGEYGSSVGTEGVEDVGDGHAEELDDPFGSTPPLVRIHSECYTGETVWSARCDCGEQLDEAARLLSLPIPTPLGDPSPNPGGVIVYLRQEGRGIGLSEKLKAYNLQDLGSDTVEANLLLRHPADARSYGLATAMLVDLGLGGDRGIRLLTNNPEKVRAVEGPGREVRVRERVAMVPIAWRTGGREGVQGKEVENYLRTKIERMSHLLQMGEA